LPKNTPDKKKKNKNVFKYRNGWVVNAFYELRRSSHAKSKCKFL
jgi:hypothetical protein